MRHSITARRIVGRVVLCVLLGAASTVALAWLLAALSPQTPWTKKHNLVPIEDAKGKLAYIEVMEYRRFGIVRLMWWPAYTSSYPGGRTLPVSDPTWDEWARTTDLLPGFKPRQERSWGNLASALERGGATRVEVEDARGWPWPALWCSLDAGVIDGGTGSHPVVGGFAISAKGVGSATFRALPLMPAWRGLLGDTAVFAGVWLLAVPGFRLIRGRIRVWLGRCPKCGYSLARIPPRGCPECGWRRPPPAGTPEPAHPV